MFRTNNKGSTWKMVPLLGAIALAAVFFNAGTASALDAPADNQTEVNNSVVAGVGYLLTQQQGNGCWTSLGVTTGVTALAMLAIINSVAGGYPALGAVEQAAVDAGTTCLLTKVQGDGSIHDGNLQTYNTSIASWALNEADQTNAAVVTAWNGGRNWLLTHQVDNGADQIINSTHDGGWTYGGNTSSAFTEHSNSSFALQALAATGGVPNSGGNTGNPAAFAEAFFTCLQNRLPSCGSQTALDGGFIYSHQLTKGGSRTSHTGSGVFALILAGVSSGDGRIVDGIAFLDEAILQAEAVPTVGLTDKNMLHNAGGNVEPLDNLHWFANNDLVYYAYWATEKAYELAGVAADVNNPSNWFYKIANALVHKQQGDGHWVPTSREDAILSTSFAMLTLRRVTPVPVDADPPSCEVTNLLPGPPAVIEVTIGDAGSGIDQINIVTAVNAGVNIPTFSSGDNGPIIVTGTKTDQSQASTLRLEVIDVAGNVTECDPVLVSLSSEPGSRVARQTVTSLPHADRYLTLYSDDSSAAGFVLVTVNGKWFAVLTSAGTIDVGPALVEGFDNTITLRVWDAEGLVMISDMVPPHDRGSGGWAITRWNSYDSWQPY